MGSVVGADAPFNIPDIVGGGLVDEVIQPVGVQQVGAGAPGHRRLAAGVIAGEVVLGDPDVRSGGQVPYVLIPQGVPVILRVAHEEDLPALVGLDGVDPGLRGGGKYLQLRDCLDVLPQHCGVPGVGHPELVVKAPEEDEVGILHRVAEHAEEFLRQLPLGDAVVVVQPRLSAPADVKGGVDVRLGPLHDLAQLRPVVHLLKGKVLHRRAGDDQAVKGPVPHLVKGFVEGQHVGLGGVLGHVAAGGDQLQLDLDGGVAQHPGQLGLGLDLGGHQVQQQDL